jgi:hypothetical protein
MSSGGPGRHQFGNKQLQMADKALKVASYVPGIGKYAALGRQAVQTADSGISLARGLKTSARATQSAIKAGDYHQAMNVVRDTAKSSYAAGRGLQSSARNILERARKP